MLIFGRKIHLQPLPAVIRSGKMQATNECYALRLFIYDRKESW